MHAIWLRKTALLFFFGVFFAASLVWFVADYAAKSRANALLVQINPNPGSVSISGGTTATTTLTLEAANGQSISAYDLRFTLEGPVYIQSAAKPVLLGSSLSQDAVTQFILSSDRLSYGFIGSSAQLSSRIEQPIVLACDASGQGKVTISSTSQIVGPSGELQLGTTSPIVVDCQGISGTARPSANSGMVITTNPTQPEQGSPYDVSISLPSIHKGKPVIGIAMQINYDPSVVSLSSMDTPYGTLQADSTVVLPADPQTGGDSVKTTTDLTTVANPQGGPATDVRGVSTLAQNTNTGPLRSCQSDADCPTSTVGRGLCLNGQCQSPVDPNAAPPVEMNGGGTGSLGSIVVDPEGTAVVKVSLSPAQADPLLTLRFQALASAADAGLTLSSIHYLTADGEDIVMPDASLGTSGDTTTPSADETSAGSGAYIVGDVNNDGVINSVDLLIIKEYLGSSDAQALDEADFNTDGAVNVQDYSMAITSFTQQFDE